MNKIIIFTIVALLISLSPFMIQDASAFLFLDSFSTPALRILPDEIKFSIDGTKLIAIDHSKDELSYLECAIAFEVKTCEAIKSTRLHNDETTPRGLATSPDGTDVFFLSSVDEQIYHLKCSSETRLTNCSNLSRDRLQLPEDGYTFRGLDVSEDGKTFYFLDGKYNAVNQLDCTTAFTVPSCQVGQKLVIPDDSPTSVLLSPDATTLLVAGNENDMIYEYSCDGTTGIENCNLIATIDISSYETQIQGLEYGDNGWLLYISGYDSTSIQTFALSTQYSTMEPEIVVVEPIEDQPIEDQPIEDQTIEESTQTDDTIQEPEVFDTIQEPEVFDTIQEPEVIESIPEEERIAKEIEDKRIADEIEAVEERARKMTRESDYYAHIIYDVIDQKWSDGNYVLTIQIYESIFEITANPDGEYIVLDEYFEQVLEGESEFLLAESGMQRETNKYDDIPFIMEYKVIRGGGHGIVYGVKIIVSEFVININSAGNYLIPDSDFEQALEEYMEFLREESGMRAESEEYADVPFTVTDKFNQNDKYSPKYFIQIYESDFTIRINSAGNYVIPDEHFEEAIDEYHYYLLAESQMRSESEEYADKPFKLVGKRDFSSGNTLYHIQIIDSHFMINANSNGEYLIPDEYFDQSVREFSDNLLEESGMIRESDKYDDIEFFVWMIRGGTTDYIIEIYETSISVPINSNGQYIVLDRYFEKAIEAHEKLVNPQPVIDEPEIIEEAVEGSEEDSENVDEPEVIREDEEPEPIVEEEKQKKGGGGCNDCTPPTLGVNSEGKRMVDNGIQINGETIEVDYFYSDMPMQYTEIGKTNTVIMKISENGGAHNIQRVNFALGIKEVSSPISTAQAIIEIDIGYFKDDIANPKLGEINLIDKDGIIGDYNVTLDLTSCIDEVQVQDVFNPDKYITTLDCLLVEIEYNYIKVPSSPVLAVNAWDYKRNTVNHYFNDGLTVIDPNPAPEEQAPEPYKWECKDPIQNNMSRNNCNFRALTEIWDR